MMGGTFNKNKMCNVLDAVYLIKHLTEGSHIEVIGAARWPFCAPSYNI